MAKSRKITGRRKGNRLGAIRSDGRIFDRVGNEETHKRAKAEADEIRKRGYYARIVDRGLADYDIYRSRDKRKR